MQMAVFEQLKITGLLCSRFSATVNKGRRFFALAEEGAELPNGKGGKKKVASQQQQPASPAISAPDGGSRVEGEMAEELLTVPGSSGVDVSARESTPPVPVVDSAAAVEESAAGALVVGPAVAPAAKPVAAKAAVSAAVPTATRGGRPVLADGPVAAPRECWVMNPGIAPKVIVRRIPSGSATAAEAATSWEIRAGEPLPELGSVPSAGRAAAEIRTSPIAETARLAVPATAAQGKRKASAGVTEGSRKRKKSSPVKIKDLQ
jgi:hypothetical protein